MSHIQVCPLSKLSSTMAEGQARWIVGLAGPGKEIDRPPQATGGFLTLSFNDIGEERDGLIAPSKSHVEELLKFADTWDRSTPLLIFCWMGISRSTAAALICAMRTNSELDVRDLVQRLRELSPMATPNPMMIRFGDELLNLEGELIKAVAEIGRGEDAFEGKPFALGL